MPDILIVDDDDPIRWAIRLMLEDEGYNVFEAPQGRDALAFLRQRPGHCVILLDMMMPVMDGQEFLKVFAADQTLCRQHACVIMTAGWNPHSSTLRDITERFHIGTLHKPFEADDLYRLIGEAEMRVRRDAIYERYDDVENASSTA